MNMNGLSRIQWKIFASYFSRCFACSLSVSLSLYHLLLFAMFFSLILQKMRALPFHHACSNLRFFSSLLFFRLCLKHLSLSLSLRLSVLCSYNVRTWRCIARSWNECKSKLNTLINTHTRIHAHMHIPRYIMKGCHVRFPIRAIHSLFNRREKKKTFSFCCCSLAAMLCHFLRCCCCCCCLRALSMALLLLLPIFFLLLFSLPSSFFILLQDKLDLVNEYRGYPHDTS